MKMWAISAIPSTHTRGQNVSLRASWPTTHTAEAGWDSYLTAGWYQTDRPSMLGKALVKVTLGEEGQLCCLGLGEIDQKGRGA